MKKVYLVLSICISITLLTSCTTEDIDDQSSLIGVWKLTSWTINTAIDLDNDGIASTEFSPGCLIDSDLTFMDDSNGTIFYSSSVSYSTRMEDGNMVFMTACTTDSERVPSLMSYTSSDSEIIINKDGVEFVLALNGNTLSMLVPNDFIAKDNETSETTVSQDVTYIYTRQ